MADTLTLPAVIAASQVRSGMTIRVHQKIKDITPSGEEKERVQVFEGLVLTVRGAGVSKTFTVRKMSSGIGVERIFPLTLPSIQRIDLVKMVKTRRKHIGFTRHSKKRFKEIHDIKLAPAKE